jgi:hypothetical protein
MKKKYEGLEQMINTRDKGVNKTPRILTIDIETSPIIAYSWGPKWETNLIKEIKPGMIISYSAKWLGGKQVTRGLIDYKGYKKGVVNDDRIIQDIHKLLDEADIVVGQNSKNYDVKFITTRILANGLPPPSPFKQVDTKQEAKKYLRLSSNSLEDMSTYFGIGNKLHHEGFELWEKCMAGDERAWNIMKKYNAQDVRLTEQIYLKLRPLMKTHPNVGVYTDTKGACPKCNSTNVNLRGFVYNATTKYQRARCMDCTGWYRVGKPIKLNNKPGVGA